jgi:uncharacterized protein YjiS (DUF1127 family)
MESCIDRPITAPRRSLIEALRQAARIARDRRYLREADDRLLDDIGITRKDAMAEGNRPIWDVPRGWRR